jgi:hypothetical protein
VEIRAVGVLSDQLCNKIFTIEHAELGSEGVTGFSTVVGDAVHASEPPSGGRSLFRLVAVILDFLQYLAGLFEGLGVLLFAYFFFAGFIAHWWSSRWWLT